jgi:hypothetical protein
MSATSGVGGGGGGGTPAIPSKGEFALRTNLALEASLRRLHSFSYSRVQVNLGSLKPHDHWSRMHPLAFRFPFFCMPPG